MHSAVHVVQRGECKKKTEWTLIANTKIKSEWMCRVLPVRCTYRWLKKYAMANGVARDGNCCSIGQFGNVTIFTFCQMTHSLAHSMHWHTNSQPKPKFSIYRVQKYYAVFHMYALYVQCACCMHQSRWVHASFGCLLLLLGIGDDDGGGGGAVATALFF